MIDDFLASKILTLTNLGEIYWEVDRPWQIIGYDTLDYSNNSYGMWCIADYKGIRIFMSIGDSGNSLSVDTNYINNNSIVDELAKLVRPLAEKNTNESNEEYHRIHKEKQDKKFKKIFGE